MELIVQNKYSLFVTRRFCPIFVATFLGAFNDNMVRSGLVVLIAYAAQHGITLPIRAEILVTICSALLVIPLLLFSHIAGALADKYEKSFLVRCTKLAEIAIMTSVYYGFATQNIILLMCMLFISGTHTTFYNPIKFSILPDHLHNKELLAANGFMAGGSYLAVLFGLITGGFLVDLPGNVIGKAALGVAGIGMLASLLVPPSAIAHPHMKIRFHLLKGMKEVVGHAARDKTVFYSILALSWFLVIGSVYMSQFANYAHTIVHGNSEVYILFLTVFSVGIAIGSLICDTLLEGEISLKLTPWALLGISVFTYLMVFNTPHTPDGPLMTGREFLADPHHWSMLACMLMVAVCGGIYIVPLYAILQSRTDAQYRSRIMAGSNLSDAALVTSGVLVCALLLWCGFSIMDLFLLVATLNLVVAYYARRFS